MLTLSRKQKKQGEKRKEKSRRNLSNKLPRKAKALSSQHLPKSE